MVKILPQVYPKNMLTLEELLQAVLIMNPEIVKTALLVKHGLVESQTGKTVRIEISKEKLHDRVFESDSNYVTVDAVVTTHCLYTNDKTYEVEGTVVYYGQKSTTTRKATEYSYS